MTGTGNNKRTGRSVRRTLLTAGLMLLLLFFTGVNYFIYGSNKPETKITWTCTEEESSESYPCNPAGPDEKSPNSPVSFTEEYIHEGEEVTNPFWINHLFQHMIHEAEKLSIVHFELLSPPPEA